MKEFQAFGSVIEPSQPDIKPEDTSVCPEPVPAKDEVDASEDEDESESEDGDAIVARRSSRNANGLVKHGLKPVWTAWGVILEKFQTTSKST